MINRPCNARIPPTAFERGSFIRVHFADLDGDGRPEIVAANKGDQNAGVDGVYWINCITSFW